MKFPVTKCIYSSDQLKEQMAIIEYVDYQASKINQLEEKLKVAIEALKFYGDKENWCGFDEEQGFIWLNSFVSSPQDYENLEGTVMTAGRKAREALAKLKREG